MENKKSFGTFICQRRKDLGMTQKEFAQRLFVTDSAVSKWERGLAYPDITLLQSICQVLQCSEKELLSSSEDAEGRRSEQLAKNTSGCPGTTGSANTLCMDSSPWAAFWGTCWASTPCPGFGSWLPQSS